MKLVHLRFGTPAGMRRSSRRAQCGCSAAEEKSLKGTGWRDKSALRTSVGHLIPIESEAGNTCVVRQQNVGPGIEFGGGEWRDPHFPPSGRPNAPKVRP